MSLHRFVVTAAVVAIGASAACGSPASGPRFLSIATGGTGGVYYPYGGVLARLLSERLQGLQATAEATGGAVENLKLIQQGKVDIAFTLADTLAAAQSGTGPFQQTGAVTNVRALAVLYTNYTHIVMRADRAVARVADLKGKVVSVGSPGSGTELVADRILEAAGLNPRTDITRHTLSVAESAGALTDGKLDAFFWSGGVPTSSVEGLAATPGFAIGFVPQADLVAPLQKMFPGDLYRLAAIPNGSYRGMTADVPVVGVTNLLVSSAALDEQVAYDVVRLMFDQKAALVAAHPEARHLEVPVSPESSPVPFHPGAARYYREHGWK